MFLLTPEGGHNQRANLAAFLEICSYHLILYRKYLVVSFLYVVLVSFVVVCERFRGAKVLLCSMNQKTKMKWDLSDIFSKRLG